MEKLINVIKI